MSEFIVLHVRVSELSTGERTMRPSAHRSPFALGPVVKFFIGYAAGRGLDYVLDSGAVREMTSAALQEVAILIGFADPEEQEDLREISKMISLSQESLTRQGLSEASRRREVSRHVQSLERSIGDIDAALSRLERRVEKLERENQIQFDRLDEVEAALDRMRADNRRQDREIAEERERNRTQNEAIRANTAKDRQQDATNRRQDDQINQGTATDIKQNNRLINLERKKQRADLFAELSGIFQSTYDFAGGEHVGIYGAIQGNATDHLGIYVAYNYAPHYAREPFVIIDDVAIVGTTFWQNHTVTAGFKVSLTPAKLPFNIQAGAGGGILVGALRVTNTGNIFAPKTSSKIGGSTQPVATLSADVALGKATWELVPFFSGQHMILFNDLAYSDLSSLGRRMWNVGVGLRLRGHVE